MKLHTRICKGSDAAVLNEIVILLLVLSSDEFANSGQIHPLI